MLELTTNASEVSISVVIQTPSKRSIIESVDSDSSTSFYFKDSIVPGVYELTQQIKELSFKSAGLEQTQFDADNWHKSNPSTSVTKWEADLRRLARKLSGLPDWCPQQAPGR